MSSRKRTDYHDRDRRSRSPKHRTDRGDRPRVKRERGGGEPDKFSVRALIDSRIIGGIIGKGGAIVKRIREDSGAWLDIADGARGCEHRMVTAKGAFSAVITCLSMVANRVAEIGARDERQPVSEIRLTIVIPEGQVGCVLGKGGRVIKNIREETGCFVKLLDEPLEGSTEKSLTIKGAAQQFNTAVQLACQQLYENMDRATSRQPYVPGAGSSQSHNDSHHSDRQRDRRGSDRSYSQHEPEFEQPGFGYGQMGGQMGQMGGQMGQMGQMGGFGQMMPPMPPFGQMPHVVPAAAFVTPPPQMTREERVRVSVPEYLIGLVIGKGGSNIRDIRDKSRATIQVAKKREPGGDRIVDVAGTRQACELAVTLVYEKMSTYRAR